MQKTAEYLSRAAECRDMARIASPSRREELEHIAAAYEQLAEMRKRRLQLLSQIRPSHIGSVAGQLISVFGIGPTVRISRRTGEPNRRDIREAGGASHAVFATTSQRS